MTSTLDLKENQRVRLKVRLKGERARPRLGRSEGAPHEPGSIFYFDRTLEHEGRTMFVFRTTQWMAKNSRWVVTLDGKLDEYWEILEEEGGA